MSVGKSQGIRLYCRVGYDRFSMGTKRAFIGGNASENWISLSVPTETAEGDAVLRFWGDRGGRVDIDVEITVTTDYIHGVVFGRARTEAVTEDDWEDILDLITENDVVTIRVQDQVRVIQTNGADEMRDAFERCLEVTNA